ncbi:hypothetical protein CRE_16078 [Caenorhabditis remanei]|uniref:BTB domain-containing protein n=1 Tax=Caenorhabditis remanei TaxID=31234 RepID=E3MBP4_CAERE|nr:hypothetical protein CRE_16078 [Caenorhabditis remanei]
MSERFKYPINGICRFENIAQLIANDDFPKIPIGEMAGFEWYVSLVTNTVDGLIRIHPYCQSNHWDNIQNLSIRYFFSYLSRKQSIKCQQTSNVNKPVLLTSRDSLLGDYLGIESLMNEKFKFLHDGALCIEYGLSVLSLQHYDKIWRFNFYDKMFDCDQKQNMITVEDCSRDDSDDCVLLFAPKQLLQFHSPLFKDRNLSIREQSVRKHNRNIRELLQIAHGVKIEAPDDVLNTADKLGFRNVARYCERQMIQERYEDMLVFGYFNLAAEYNLNHYLAHLLRHVGPAGCLAAVLMTVDIEKLSSEYMKQCTKYFFENA